MKKTLLLFLSIAVFLTFAACDKSEYVLAVEEAIAAIGTVTLDSQEAIDSAKTLYDTLTDEDKDKVANQKVLEEAGKRYRLLVEEKEAKEKAFLESDEYEFIVYLAHELDGGAEISSSDVIYDSDTNIVWVFRYFPDDLKELLTDSSLPTSSLLDVCKKLPPVCQEMSFLVLEMLKSSDYDDINFYFAIMAGDTDGVYHANDNLVLLKNGEIVYNFFDEIGY